MPLSQASFSTSPSLSPTAGDHVSYLVTGTVVKRQGTRLQVSGDDGATSQVTAILPPSVSPPKIGSAAELSASSIAVITAWYE